MRYLYSLCLLLAMLIVVPMTSCKEEPLLDDLAATAWSGTEKGIDRDRNIQFYFDPKGRLTIKREDAPVETIGPFEVSIKKNTMSLLYENGNSDTFYIVSYSTKHMILEFNPGAEGVITIRLKRVR